jgi:hypothetical protein
LLTPICIHGHFAPWFFPCDKWWVFTKYLLNITREKTSFTFKLCKAFEGGFYWIQIHVQLYFTRPLVPIKFNPSTRSYIWSFNQIFRVDFFIVLKSFEGGCYVSPDRYGLISMGGSILIYISFVKELFLNIVGMLMSLIQDNYVIYFHHLYLNVARN